MITSTFTTAPTATSQTYTVVANDTLGTIASRFGVTVNGLEAANPGVLPQFLRIGQVLVIPVSPSTPMALPTPVELQPGPVRCYPQMDRSLWCLTLILNPLTDPVSGVSVHVSLYGDIESPPVAERTVDPPLRFIGAGDALPVSAFFPPEEAKGTLARATILAAVSSSMDTIIPVEILSKDSTVLTGGMEVTISFRLGSGAKQAARRMDAVLTLLDADGTPVGMRILRQSGTWQPGQGGRLVMRAYSLATPPADYRMALEAHS